jgi:hypothetical protein
MPRRRRCSQIPRRSRRLVRFRTWALMYRIRRWGLVALAAVLAAVTAVMSITGWMLLGSVVTATVLVGWLAYTLRLVRLQPAGPPPRGDGPAPPGGAAVREPRRPMPLAPAGAAALPLPEADPRQGLAAHA